MLSHVYSCTRYYTQMFTHTRVIPGTVPGTVPGTLPGTVPGTVPGTQKRVSSHELSFTFCVCPRAVRKKEITVL